MNPWRQTAIRVWQEEFTIHSYEIGPQGFASPQTLCRFLQEAASNHVAHLDASVEKMKDLKEMWVLYHLNMQMQTYPSWHDRIKIETWPVVHTSPRRHYRDFNVRDRNNELLGYASSIWLILDEATRRPVNIPQSVMNVAGESSAEHFVEPIKDSDLVGVPWATRDFVIRGSDIDWNLHVNNVCYLEWALETVPAIFRLQNSIVDLDVSFYAEEKYGSTVVSQYFKPDDEAADHYHRIADKTSDKTLALLRMRWKPKEHPFMQISAADIDSYLHAHGESSR